MWHGREKTSISSFSWKVRDPCVRKKSTWDWRRGEEKLDKGLSWLATWNCLILVFEHQRSFFVDLHWHLLVFRQLLTLYLKSNQDIVQSSGKNFQNYCPLQVVEHQNLTKFLVNSQVHHPNPDFCVLCGDNFSLTPILFTPRSCVFGPIQAIHCSLTLPMSHHRYNQWSCKVENGI